MDDFWIGIYERLVNTDTGFEVPLSEKLDSTEFLMSILRGWGFEIQRTGASHIAKIGEPPYVTFIGHLDTVFKRGEPERRPFERKGDVVKGPGVADMKGGIVVMLMSLERIIEDFKNVSIAVLMNVDEEMGSRWSVEDHLKMADESSFCLSFETGRRNGGVVVSRKGIASLRIVSHGKAGHASIPSMGINAILEISKKIPKVSSIEMDGMTIVPTMISGGFKTNVIPDRAEVFFDVRYPDVSDLDELKSILDEMFERPDEPGATSTYELEVSRPPMRRSEKAVEILGKVMEKLGVNYPLVDVGGGGDASFYTSKGVPAIDGLGIVGENIHSDREVARIDSVPGRISLIEAIFEEISLRP